MKNKIYQKTSILITAIFMLILFGTQKSSAQAVTIYNQNFNAAYPNWPTGWSASPSTNGWLMDTSGANNSSGTYYGGSTGEGTYTGASGGAMVDISDPTSSSGNGRFYMYSDSISTVGYDSITVIWGARNSKHYADSGSYNSLAWSSDGVTWDSLPYTENTNNSDWALVNNATPIALPANAANQDKIIFRWTSYLFANSSGTYRIDDINVAGAVISTGISTVNAVLPVNLFPNPASDFVTINNLAGKNYTVRLTDVTGKILKTVYISGNKNRIDVSDIAPGFYMAQLISSDNNLQSQVIKFAIIR